MLFCLPEQQKLYYFNTRKQYMDMRRKLACSNDPQKVSKSCTTSRNSLDEPRLVLRAFTSCAAIPTTAIMLPTEPKVIDMAQGFSFSLGVNIYKESILSEATVIIWEVGHAVDGCMGELGDKIYTIELDERIQIRSERKLPPCSAARLCSDNERVRLCVLADQTARLSHPASPSNRDSCSP